MRAAVPIVALLAVTLAGCSLRVPEAIAPRSQPTLVDRWTRQAEALRGLEFTSPVEVRWILSSHIPRITRDEMEADLPDGYVAAYRDAYAAIGVLPPDLDLLETLTSLQEDQLVGLYSTRHRTMYVVRGMVGSDRTTILVHELVHALQHQHFPQTIELLQGLRRNDDVVSSIASALEGDASLTMHGALHQRNLDLARRMSDIMVADLENPTGVMARVPRFLSASLIFPYAYGVLLAGQHWNVHQNAGLDQLVRDPPLSTTRVLFPDDLEAVDFVRLPERTIQSALAGRACGESFDNVAGALTLRVLFEDHGNGEPVDEMLRSWTGDRFMHLPCADGAEMVWVSLWDDPFLAAEFAERYRAIAPGIAQGARLSGTPQVRREGRLVLVTSPGLRPIEDRILAETEIRAYHSTADWVADDCFPESPCPVGEHRPVVAAGR